MLELSWLPTDGSIFAPAVALAGTSTLTSTSASPLGALALRWQAIDASFCPVALPIASGATVRPCTGLEVGSLRGEGVAIDNARRNDAPWVALALSGQIDIALWSRLALVIDVGAASPFTRSRFSYSSGTTAFETPVVGGRFGLTLALRL